MLRFLLLVIHIIHYCYFHISTRFSFVDKLHKYDVASTPKYAFLLQYVHGLFYVYIFSENYINRSMEFSEKKNRKIHKHQKSS